MKAKRWQYSPAETNSIFARLDPQDVERFYQSYQLWILQRKMAGLQTQITGLQQQIAENNERLQQAHPSPIALAALAQLQSHDVTDIDLLDHMLERGETWLDQTMQRLAYCEQFDFIRNNYSEWCEHALDGAYDWIDSMQHASSSVEESTLTAASITSADHPLDALEEATEEILLQKLMSDEEAFMAEPTLKRPAVSPAHPDLPPTSTAQASTLEQAENAPVAGEPETGQAVVEPSQLEVEQVAQPQFSESTSETSEEHMQSDESIVSTQEEVIHGEFSDIPDSSHVPIVQALEVESPPAHDEDTSLEEPLPISDNTSLSRAEPMPSEAKRLPRQTAKQESTQRSSKQHLQVSRSRRKGGFLRQLFAVFFHK